MKSKKSKTYSAIFVLILLLASFLRFWKISQGPPSLNWDEVSHGYNAYSILKTGKDEWGKGFPLIFRAYGDYKLPAYIYLTALSVALLGTNAFAVRLPSVLAGISTVAFSYLIAKKLFNQKTALLTAFLVAVEPWSFFLSRAAFEANLALAFFVSGVYFFLRSLEKSKNLVVSCILFGLSVWTYNSYRIFTPLFLLVLVFIYRESLLTLWKKDTKTITSCFLIFALFFLPMFYQLFNPSGLARYEKVTIVDSGAIGQIIQSRNDSNFNPLVTRLIYNRPTYFISHFVKNYFSYLSPKFLFLKGGSDYQFSIPEQGILYPVNLVFLLIGVVILLKKRNKARLVILFWIFLAPLVPSLTRESPHVLRSVTFLPTPMLISAIGVTFTSDKLGKKIGIATMSVYCLLLSLFFCRYFDNYLNNYRKTYSWSWQYGYKGVVDYARKNYDKYDKIIVTKKYGEPHEFFLFFWPWDPESFFNDSNLIRFNQSNWYWVDRFDKFYFVNDWDVPKEEWQSFKLESGSEFDCAKSRCLLITSPENYPKGWEKLKSVNFLNGSGAFTILENI